MSSLLHREVSGCSSHPTNIHLACTVCKALSLPPFVMTVKKDSCQYKASMTGQYINKQINGKESLDSADFDCSLPCAGSQSPCLPDPATQTQSLEDTGLPWGSVVSPTGGREEHWDRQTGEAFK